MPDPYQKVNPGDKLRLPATTWNKLVDLAKQGDQAAINSLAGRQSSLPRTPDRIKIRNDSGTDVPRFGVLGLDELVIKPDQQENEFLRQPFYSGIKPADPDHVGRFAVLLEPLAQGKTGTGLIAGIVPVKLKVAAGVTASDFGRADIIVDDVTQLEPRPFGAEILETLADDWALIRLGDRGGDLWCKVTATDGIAARSGGTVAKGEVTILTEAFEDSTATFEAYNGVTTKMDKDDIVIVNEMGGPWRRRPFVTNKDCA